MSFVHYPKTRMGTVIDSVAGLDFVDPYRWLEYDSEDVKQWQYAQNKMADAAVMASPNFSWVQQSVEKYSVGGIGMLPRFAAGKWFGFDAYPERGIIGLCMSDEPYGLGKFIPMAETRGEDADSFPVWFSPSPDGKILAFGLCRDGSENNTIELIEIETGKRVSSPPKQRLMDGFSGGAIWLPDSSGFYFTALSGEPEDFRQQIWLHHVKHGTQTLVDVPMPEPDSREYSIVSLSPSGRYRLINQGLTCLKPIALIDTKQRDAQWRPFITELNGSVIGHIVDDHLVAITDIDAPRGRIVCIPLDSPSPNDPNSWTELVAESEAVIRSHQIVDRTLYITEFVETYSRIRQVNLDTAETENIVLPGLGAVSEPRFPLSTLVPTGWRDRYLFGFSSLTESWGVYSHRPGSVVIETLQAPVIQIQDAVVEDHWACSADGESIPYHIVRRADADQKQSQPTLIYAYGGYNVARPPEFPGPMAAFVEAGGLYVHAHVRGGSEFGRAWWDGGRMKNKQNCFNDVYAIAEQLIDQGRTHSAQLALTGRSNGGLLAAVAMMQRPELWKAVVPQVPVLDLIGALRHPYGRYCIEIEYADPENSEAVADMVKYSPYHLVRKGCVYPSVYLSAGATDPRCPPWHARKFSACLQANGHPASVLLKVWENSGHGQATSQAQLAMQFTHWLTFLTDQLKMRPGRCQGNNALAQSMTIEAHRHD